MTQKEVSKDESGSSESRVYSGLPCVISGAGNSLKPLFSILHWCQSDMQEQVKTTQSNSGSVSDLHARITQECCPSSVIPGQRQICEA